MVYSQYQQPQRFIERARSAAEAVSIWICGDGDDKRTLRT